MTRGDGSLARTLDFGETDVASGPSRNSGIRPRLRLASARLAGPAKYAALEARRRQAQIKARRLLDLPRTERSEQHKASGPA
jgi:hypothetical protein